jgi:hypothetical protein
MSRYNLSAKPMKFILKPSGVKPVELLHASCTCHTLAVVFGFDHAMGCFFDIYTPANKEEGTKEVVHVEASTTFDGISRSHILEIVDYYADDEEKKALGEVLALCALDLPF